MQRKAPLGAAGDFRRIGKDHGRLRSERHRFHPQRRGLAACRLRGFCDMNHDSSLVEMIRGGLPGRTRQGSAAHVCTARRGKHLVVGLSSAGSCSPLRRQSDAEVFSTKKSVLRSRQLTPQSRYLPRRRKSCALWCLSNNYRECG